MKTYKYTRTTDEPRLLIGHDEFTESPRLNDCNLGYFITVDSNYHSPDQHEDLEAIVKATGDEAEDQADHIKRIKEEYNQALPQDDKVLAIFPIVKYEHSGVSYSLGTVHNWDYSNNGFYIITKKTLAEVGTPKKDWEDVIKMELNEYNHYANGELYCFTLFNKNGEQVDGCGGFFDLEAIQNELPDEWKNEDLTEYIK